ncbi:hypothetical protein QSV08_07820 [Maribacter sp. BPC-D8]|uniref:hypothetical protein n=1 Tax=Maribacter sp. BPC-D8 TaxID=3053613 RepID=UPI002B46B7F3|nr:hypothetical protein [Maribacter sp. BPC-D8]WRI31152.1 hypothetical protein QSV08_07820 [Maribacter sp. BPC-D8]
MKYIYLVLFLIIVSCNEKVKNNDLKESSKISQKIKKNDNENKRKEELTYVRKRNSTSEYFENKEFNDSIYDEMNDSILVLEKLLQHIILPTKVEDINKTGQINLETFLPEIGFGMLDGLITYKEEVSLLCTTSFIFSDYFKDQGYKIDNISESEIEDIFSSAFASDYVITSIKTFKINVKENIQAYGMISLDGQDIGPFKPNALYALVSYEDNIYLINKSIKRELKGLEKCTTIGNNEYEESEEKAWKHYCECYEQQFSHNEQFLPLKKEIEEMIKLVIK